MSSSEQPQLRQSVIPKLLVFGGIQFAPLSTRDGSLLDAGELRPNSIYLNAADLNTPNHWVAAESEWLTVTENIISKQTFIEARTMPHSMNASGSKFMTSGTQRPSAHLTLRDTSAQGFPQYPIPSPGLHQSCRHVVRTWANQSFGAHLHNMTLSNGKLRVPQDGRYYLYSQVYFRYPSPATSDGDQRSVSHQLVQCVYKKTSYPSPIQLLKGVGTKCWAPDAEYALHSVYQGGLFELRAGDELFVSVSSPTMVNADDSSSYFGAFRLDL
ncbi:TNF superfamily member 10, like [Lampris incognitus]|uniref:TNF superfamily member 10, like n=1 Tax=Lampris incognitus TaxID=2546036 RepID=UPI0024B626D1|nr:TNF superfamily member 10, like [Lampris incognitus]